MFRRILLFIVIMFPFYSMADVVEYDSLCNVNKNNIDKLVDQILFYPKSKYIWTNLFWKNKNGKIYKYDKYNSSLLNGKYSKDDEVLGEKFLVKGIISNGDYPLLECRKLSNNDLVYINCYFIDNAFPPFCVEGFYEKMKNLYVNKNIYAHKSKLEKCGLTISSLDVENNQEIVPLECKSIKIGVGKYGVYVYLRAKGSKSNNIYEILSDKILDVLLSNASVDSIRKSFINRVELETIEYALQKKRMQEEIYNKLLKKYVYDNKGNKQTWYYIDRAKSVLERFEAYTITKIEICENSNILKRYNIEFEKKNNSEKVQVTAFLSEDLQFSFLENECSNSDYKKLYPKIKNWNAIKDGIVKRGMTTQEVRLSWGPPKDINVSEGILGVHEQWVYDDEYVYFENGSVSAIQY